MAQQLVIADASPIIILAQVNGLPWLKILFGQVQLTSIVRDEVLPGTSKPGELRIQEAFQDGTLAVLEKNWADMPFPALDEGEASCIRAALHYSGKKCLLLIDERMGRAIAQEHGIAVAGAAGVIGMAKIQGLIPSAATVFETLLLTDFRIAPEVIRGILYKTGEA
jgi:predicted nucleic acid-binding protein